MSLILDALKKSELERRGQRALPSRRVPSMEELLEGPKAAEKQAIKWPLILGMFVIACGVSAGVTYQLLKTPSITASIKTPPTLSDETGTVVDAPIIQPGPVEPVTDAIDIVPPHDSESLASANEETVPDAEDLTAEPDTLPDPTAEVAADSPVSEFVESTPPPTSSDVVVIYAAEPGSTPLSAPAVPDEAAPTAEAMPETSDTEINETETLAVTNPDPTIYTAPHEPLETEPAPLAETTIESAQIDEIATIDPGEFSERKPAVEDRSIPDIPLASRKPVSPPQPAPSLSETKTGDPVELYQRASALEQEGLYDRAIETYTAAILARPNFAEAYYGRAWAHIGNESFDAAIRNFDTVISINSGIAEAYFGRAWALELTGRYRDAITDYSAAIERAPDERSLLFNRGILRLYTDDFAGADADFMTIRKFGTAADHDYALLWAFIARARDGASPTEIFPLLRDVPAKTDWPGKILDFYFGRLNREGVLRDAREAPYPDSAKRLTIAHYFLGQYALINGDTASAVNDFRLAVDEKATGVRQYWAANLELERLGVAF